MLIDSVRVSKQARDQLITLRRRTGIENWNVVCRWAFCASLASRLGTRSPARSLVRLSASGGLHYPRRASLHPN
jgi:DNA sulfur modification protein DndE